MKLATLNDGSRDGRLLVVSRDLGTAVSAPKDYPTMQAALDNWAECEPELQKLYGQLNDNTAADAFELKIEQLAAPLRRSYQYLDGACYISHIQRNRQARGDSLPDDILDAPLVYQGISHGYMSWNDPIKLPREEDGIDFEAEIAAVTGDVPIGVSPEEAVDYIRLFVLLQDTSLRALVPPELKRTFGFLTSKPCSALGPIAVTPDELGNLWDGKMVHGKMNVWVRGKKFAEIESGIDSPFHYGDMIAHVAITRPFEPGTIVGLGTVSNEDDSVGCGCIGEQRAMEIIKTGEAKTPLLRFGDSLRIEHLDYEGNSIFGPIEQKVSQLQ
ncbi:MAG: fumarylacetoacetate hydrolase family protein [Lacipirellulaceae bacterium]|uniref:fumarylacetoacetate hydrolase family protein n=1 Tax=Marinobacter salarius TaxID=1420917 RepID=UPI0032EFA340